MLIYGEDTNHPFSVATYKSTNNHTRSSNRKKVLKLAGRPHKQHKAKKSKKNGGKSKKKVKRVTRRKIKKLSSNNVKLLKKLGLKVKHK